jgi:polysaccharide deacetylase
MVMTQCSRFGSSDRPTPAMIKCRARLRTIPELAGILREDGRPVPIGQHALAGVKMALTITGSLKSVADPNEDADDVCYTQNSVENQNRLIKTLKDNGLPPTVEFISGRDFDPKTTELWLQSGNLIGSMSYDPHSAVRLTEDSFMEAVSKMDQALEPLLVQYGQKTKYFRYTHLKPSRKPEVRSREDSFLVQNGYTIVSASITGYDQQFAWLYCSAIQRRDSSCVDLIKASFFPLLLDSIERSRKFAREVTGNAESKHILELRANQFTVDNLNEIIRLLRQFGVEFVPLDEALSDPLYRKDSKKGMPATFVLVKKIEQEQTNQANAGVTDD